MIFSRKPSVYIIIRKACPAQDIDYLPLCQTLTVIFDRVQNSLRQKSTVGRTDLQVFLQFLFLPFSPVSGRMVSVCYDLCITFSDRYRFGFFTGVKNERKRKNIWLSGILDRSRYALFSQIGLYFPLDLPVLQGFHQFLIMGIRFRQRHADPAGPDVIQSFNRSHFKFGTDIFRCNFHIRGPEPFAAGQKFQTSDPAVGQIIRSTFR